ncbi:MAG TPA: alpha/beta hydrolase [Acidimicrobiales bacterium]|nr:alpha/beta hydrolase [Acidimicrobiales bacterium]
MARFASFDGTEIFYEASGSGPPVVLIHGAISDSRRGWVDRGIPDELETAGYQVVMFDLRGHGRSDKPHQPDAYAGDALALDAQQLLDHLGLDAAHVVAYSLGSRIAARLAVLDGRVRSLVLGGCGDADAGGPTSAWFAGVMEAEDLASLDPAGQAMRAEVASRGGDRLALAAMARARVGGEDRIDVEGITVPTLFLTGVDDHLPGEVGPLLERLPGGRWVKVPGDHFTAPGDPGFLNAIVDFLSQVKSLTAS